MHRHRHQHPHQYRHRHFQSTSHPTQSRHRPHSYMKRVPSPLTRFSDIWWMALHLTECAVSPHGRKFTDTKIPPSSPRWSLVVICPGLVLGPPLSTACASSESVALLMRLCSGIMYPAAPNIGLAWVDIRDVAAVHCLAITTPGACGRWELGWETRVTSTPGGTAVEETAVGNGKVVGGISSLFSPSHSAVQGCCLGASPHSGFFDSQTG